MQIGIISKTIEDFTRETIFRDLATGDPSWDIAHTTAVVYHIKKLLVTAPQLKGLDATVLILAAYAHDWGYSKYYKLGKSLTKEEYITAKKTHAQLSEQKMRDLMENQVFDSIVKPRKERILHLIRVHDNIDSLREIDELALMEADTLGGLDTNFVTSTWTKEEEINHMLSVRQRRLPHFITDYGKQEFERCFALRMASAKKR